MNNRLTAAECEHVGICDTSYQSTGEGIPLALCGGALHGPLIAPGERK